MTAKHTPGPWTVWNYGESAIDVAVGPAAGGVAVAQIVTANANGISTPSAMEAGEANARLVAAAPELYELAKLAAGINPYGSPHNADTRDMAVALVEKIEGRYNLARIAWELERTAVGDAFYGNALRVAKDINGLTADDRSLLDRYATGRNSGTDHAALQDLALRVDSIGKAA